MVFSLFGRSKIPPEEGAMTDQIQQTQLRTPSPTVSISAGTVPPQSPEIIPSELPRGVKRSRSLSPKPTTTGTLPGAPLSGNVPSARTSPADLLSRIKKVPPKILHTYVVSNLQHVPPEISEALMTFFATLQPPPKLHCVRCHKDFVEVENTDRSCQTLWGCCNRVVEGDGDQGPPDGWCFEGFHTTDVKRARFRADSTIHDDKLVSCVRMRCFGAGSSIAGSERGRSRRAAARKSLREASDEEEDYDEQELAREAQTLADGGDAGESVSAIAKKKPTKSRKHKSDTITADPESKDEPGDGVGPTATSSTAKRKPKGKAESVKPKSGAKAKRSSADPRPPTSIPADADVEMTAAEGEPKPKPKKPRKPRKSAADGGKYVPPKDDEESSDFNEEEDKPKRKKAKRKSTISVVASST